MATDMKYCRKCGTENKRDAKFCRKCGTEFTASKTGEASKTVKEENFTCEYCGQPITSGAVKCSHCDADIPENVSAKLTATVMASRAQQSAVKSAGKTTKESTVKPVGKAPRESTVLSAGKRIRTETATKSSTRARKTGGKDSKKSTGFGKRGVAIVLVIALVFTGFVKPGFFRPKKPSDTLYTASLDYKPSLPVDEKEDFHPDLAEIERITPSTAEISNDAPVTEVDGLGFDFFCWNLENENDTLEVRSAGTMETDDASYRMFDFSLASGQHEFLTDVSITIPLEEGEEDAEVVWYDPEQKEWVPQSYRYSEDGKSITLYTNHFSIGAIKKSEKDARKSAQQMVEKEDAQGGLFYIDKMTKSGAAYPELQQPIRYDHSSEVRRMYLERPKITEVLRSDGLQAEALYETGVEEMLTRAGTVMGYEDALNTVTGFASSGEGYRDKVLKLMTSNKQTVEAGSQTLGMFLWLWSATNTMRQVLTQLQKNDDKEAIIWHNMPAMLGCVSGFAGLFAASGGTASIVLAAVGLCTTFGPEIYQSMSQIPVDIPESAYFYFLNNGTYLTPDGRMVYSRQSEEDIQLKLDGSGWKEAYERLLKYDKGDPAMLEKDIESLYDTYVNRFFDDVTLDAGISMTIQNFDEIKEAAGNKDTTWMNMFGNNMEDALEAIWKQSHERYEDHAKDVLIQNTKMYLYAVLRSMLNEVDRQLAKDMNEIILPYLNQRLVFEVADGSAGSGTYFGDTVYADNEAYPNVSYYSELEPYSVPKKYEDTYDISMQPLCFKDQSLAGFCPSNQKLEDYPAYRFSPHGTKGSNTVFVCSRYFYMMMGEPTSMEFRGDRTDQNPSITAEFTVEDDVSSPTQTIVIPLKRTEEKGSAGQFAFYLKDGSSVDGYRQDLLDYTSHASGFISPYTVPLGLTYVNLTVTDEGDIYGGCDKTFSCKPEGSDNVIDNHVVIDIKGKLNEKTMKAEISVTGSVDSRYEFDGKESYVHGEHWEGHVVNSGHLDFSAKDVEAKLSQKNGEFVLYLKMVCSGDEVSKQERKGVYRGGSGVKDDSGIEEWTDGYNDTVYGYWHTSSK